MYLVRVDASRNVRRFYSVNFSYNLFNEPCVIRTWGRIGGAQQSKVMSCESENEAKLLVWEYVWAKIRRGYCVK